MDNRNNAGGVRVERYPKNDACRHSPPGAAAHDFSQEIFRHIAVDCRPNSNADDDIGPYFAHDFLRAATGFSDTIIPAWLVSNAGPLLTNLNLPNEILNIFFWFQTSYHDAAQDSDGKACQQVEAGNLPTEQAK